MDRREWAAGALLALTPFCKEPYLLAPATVVVWAWALDRRPWRAFGLASVGAVAYVAVRTAIDLPMPANALFIDTFGVIGAVAARGLHLLVVPADADALPTLVPNAVAGVVAVLGGLGLLLAARRSPAVGALAPRSRSSSPRRWPRGTSGWSVIVTSTRCTPVLRWRARWP